MKIPGLFFIKLAVTGLVIFLLFSFADPVAVLRHIAEVPLHLFAYAVAAYLVATFVGTVRWSMLLSLQGIRVPLIHLFVYNLSFAFYVVALPTGKIAAEAVRIYQLVADTEGLSREKIVIASLMDRAIAALSFVCIAVPFFLLTGPALTFGFPAWVWYAGGIALVLLLAVSLFPQVVNRLLSFLLPASSFSASLGTVFTSYRSQPHILFFALILSLMMNAIVASGLYALASFSAPLSFISALSVFSIGMLAAILPLTIGGIGIKEGTFSYLIAALSGASFDAALSVSLTLLAASFVLGAVGGVVELYRHFLKPRV